MGSMPFVPLRDFYLRGLREAGRALGSMSYAVTLRSRLCIATVIVALGWHINATFSAAFGEEPPSLAAIKAGYLEAISSVHTIDCSYRVSATSVHEKDFEILSWFQVRQIRDGDKLAITVEAGPRSGSKTNRFWTAYDGTKYLHWSESTHDSSGYFPPVGQIDHKVPASMNAPYLVECFLGARLWNGFDLRELLDQATAKVIGWEEIEGVDCVLVDLGEHEAVKSKNATKRPRANTKAWFDPSHTYLPKRIASHLSEKPSVTLDIDVASFASFLDAHSNQTVFVPKNAVSATSTSKHVFELDTAVVNAPVSHEAFVPKFPEGTAVKETIHGKAPRIFVVGDPNVRKQFVEKAQKLGLTSSSPNNQQPTAAPIATQSVVSDLTWWVRLRWIGSITLVIAAGTILWRQWRRA